jgi:hypothetical protein
MGQEQPLINENLNNRIRRDSSDLHNMEGHHGDMHTHIQSSGYADRNIPNNGNNVSVGTISAIVPSTVPHNPPVSRRSYIGIKARKKHEIGLGNGTAIVGSGSLGYSGGIGYGLGSLHGSGYMTHNAGYASGMSGNGVFGGNMVGMGMQPMDGDSLGPDGQGGRGDQPPYKMMRTDDGNKPAGMLSALTLFIVLIMY